MQLNVANERLVRWDIKASEVEFWGEPAPVNDLDQAALLTTLRSTAQRLDHITFTGGLATDFLYDHLNPAYRSFAILSP
jgi:hypothetical protein